MKTALLLAMSTLAALTVPSVASATAHCISFAPAGFCDAVQFNNNTRAVWINWDCAGSNGVQSSATYGGNPDAANLCIGLDGCNPADGYGWDMLMVKIDKLAKTATMYGCVGTNVTVLQADTPVAITTGACPPPPSNPQPGAISSLSRKAKASD